MIGTIIVGLCIIFAALAFIALGMAVATRYNKMAWNKYYEGLNAASNGTSSRRGA